jgi:hypothetical protein
MNRKTTFFLALSQCGVQRLSARITKSLPSLKRDEIALALTVELPDALFEKPSLQATVTIPEASVKAPFIAAEIIDNIRAVVSRELVGVNLSIAVVEPTALGKRAKHE